MMGTPSPEMAKHHLSIARQISESLWHIGYYRKFLLWKMKPVVLASYHGSGKWRYLWHVNAPYDYGRHINEIRNDHDILNRLGLMLGFPFSFGEFHYTRSGLRGYFELIVEAERKPSPDAKMGSINTPIQRQRRTQ